MDKNTQQGLFFSLTAALCGSTSPIFSKLILEYYSPSFALLIRMVLSSVFMIIIVVLIIREKIIVNKETLRIAIFGALNIVFFMFAIKYIPAHFAPVFYSLVPIEVTLLAFIIYREKISPIKLLGIVIGYLGSLLVVVSTFAGKDNSGVDVIGIVLVVCASMSIALFSLFIQVSNDRYSSYNISLQSILVSALCSIPIFLTSDGIEPQKEFSIKVLFYLVGISLFASIGQYVMFPKAIAKIKASANVAFFYSQPFMVILMSVLFLGEDIKPIYFVGLIIVLIGSSLNLLSKNRVQTTDVGLD